ncbi:hypothetical protein EMIHUDRAFT_424207 [Emiliania huxleyi CCMP1516]|uniref:Uncharacterized protein n=2 Tax=Emiliania huxleyi TaxID=2903 RepID=A0A0D3JVF0_EMIH1|nr:hypothetical protein EMIHUDRAFT_444521 [Emiliania huxleyi CCMP1516]XP_005779914.1 hypothetical protein EMIHUDRAFT_424207 [Emiliania huxleyi CCMP1516]EOD21282.1 hypothetical protein EMIHUDRAFT_444521 [Emiliania huxleyi CCMP1516]EOD27485.1 hypothetical protein EMIHUDRAFT_424207 [Emiliania huxleyi CCMP1516]|eukprot:XP_005773711.1 hypothetical protein EMIHUDRAFT_444521 [Emiliania huxleyi CCMP1516]
MGWKAAARHLGLAFKAFAQYEEPPGGCGAPPIDDPVPPTPERVADGDAAAAEREARAYEAELAAHQSGAAEWETLEREHLWELFWRDTTQKIAALAAMVFVLWLLYSRYRQLRGGSTLTRESAKLASGYKAPDKADLKAKASASGSGEASGILCPAHTIYLGPISWPNLLTSSSPPLTTTSNHLDASLTSLPFSSPLGSSQLVSAHLGPDPS